MTDQPDRASSFAGVADSYDRGRPGYPREAAAWLAGEPPRTVLELGAGTGKLTDHLLALGHDVVASDPLEEMLAHLRFRHPGCRTLVASAEDIPLAAASVDVVVCAQAFHWFDHHRALPEIARVLRPRGSLALVWNERDERIPWVRRLGRILQTPTPWADATGVLVGSRLFGFVEEHTYRFWHPMGRRALRDLALSCSSVAVLPVPERDRVLREVDRLYEEYHRGPDGLLLPYLTRCFRATVRPGALSDTTTATARPDSGARPPDPRDPGRPTLAGPGDDDGSLLFRLT